MTTIKAAALVGRWVRLRESIFRSAGEIPAGTPLKIRSITLRRFVLESVHDVPMIGFVRVSVPADLFDVITERHCRACGCTSADCRGCVERTGEPCRWVAEDLCSACAEVGAT